MNPTQRKVFVLNTPAHDGENVVVSAEMGLTTVVDSAGKLLFAVNTKGLEVTVIPHAHETAQVVEITFPTIVANTTYTVIRETNPAYMIGRDANQVGNTKKYTYRSPAVLGVAATEKTNAINALVAKINADASNFATAANKAGGNLILQITDDGGYGLLPSNPGPASWMMTNATAAQHSIATAAVLPFGIANVMLANKALWTLDKTQLRSGDLLYNFDNELPTADKTYDLVVFSSKYNMKDHFAANPDITTDLYCWVDTVDADNLNDFKWAAGVSGFTQAQ